MQLLLIHHSTIHIKYHIIDSPQHTILYTDSVDHTQSTSECELIPHRDPTFSHTHLMLDHTVDRTAQLLVGGELDCYTTCSYFTKVICVANECELTLMIIECQTHPNTIHAHTQLY